METNNSKIILHENEVEKICNSEYSFFIDVFVIKLMSGHKNFPQLISYDIKKSSIRLKRYREITHEELIQNKDKIIRAVHDLHKNGIIHGDLKPDNILMDGEEPIIIDFGNSNFVTQKDISWCCTPDYAPPRKYWSRELYSFDVWSLGQIFSLDLPEEPELRENALTLLGEVPEPIYYPEISLDVHQWTNVYQVYMYRTVEETLLSISFSHLQYQDMMLHVSALRGYFGNNQYTEVVKPEFNLLVWAKQFHINHNQILWCLVKNLPLSKVFECPTTKPPRYFFINSAIYQVYLETSEQAQELFKHFQKNKTDANITNYVKFENFCKHNGITIK